MKTSVQTQSSPITKHGDYQGVVSRIITIFTGNRPVVFTTIEGFVTELVDGHERKTIIGHTTHAVRLHDPQSREIGLNELRAAFPNVLATLDDKALLLNLANHSSALIGKRVDFTIQPQMRKGIVQKNDQGEAYFNVRLRPVEAMSESTASSLIDSLLSKLPDDTAHDAFAQQS